MTPPPTITLASGSQYRRELLARLGLDFRYVAADIDESRQSGEAPAAMAARLAAAKAHAVNATHGLIIGSDQVPALGDAILRKPGNRPAAVRQLEDCQGRTVSFYTALYVLEADSGRSWEHIDETRVRFASVGRSQLERYVDIEKPFDCAGGFKAEGLGISLFEEIASTDPTALIGLPLIALAGILRAAGADPLGS